MIEDYSPELLALAYLKGLSPQEVISLGNNEFRIGNFDRYLVIDEDTRDDMYEDALSEKLSDARYDIPSYLRDYFDEERYEEYLRDNYGYEIISLGDKEDSVSTYSEEFEEWLEETFNLNEVPETFSPEDDYHIYRIE